jgi:hypothetical protein
MVGTRTVKVAVWEVLLKVAVITGDSGDPE